MAVLPVLHYYQSTTTIPSLESGTNVCVGLDIFLGGAFLKSYVNKATPLPTPPGVSV